MAAAASAPAEPEVQDAPEVHKLPEKPVHTEIEAPADVSCAPPAVSVTIKGAPVTAEEPKAASKAFTSEPAQVIPVATMFGPFEFCQKCIYAGKRRLGCPCISSMSPRCQVPLDESTAVNLRPLPQQEKKGRGLRRALIGLAAIAAASVAVLNARR